MLVKDFTFSIQKMDLLTPYKLSYKTMYYYEAIITIFTLNNNVELYGEVTPLVGYTDETVTSIIEELEKLKPLIINSSVLDILLNLENIINKDNAFALSSILPPLEHYQFQKATKATIEYKDLVYFLSYESKLYKDFLREFTQLRDLGYQCVKIKIGKNITKELEMLDILKKIDLKGLRIRFDANCGYTFKESQQFLEKASFLLSPYTDYLEQPLCKTCWKEMELLNNKGYSIPIMVDESIFTMADIQKCKDIGVKYIKIKLCKFGSLNNLQKAVNLANALNLSVVFGNGVASDIANFYEILFFNENEDKVYGAIESVGFLKLTNTLKYELLKGK